MREWLSLGNDDSLPSDVDLKAVFVFSLSFWTPHGASDGRYGFTSESSRWATTERIK